MAEPASNCLFLFFLSLLAVSSSGTLVGFSYNAREITAASSLSRTVSFLEQNKVSASHLRVFASDHRVLSTLSNFNVSVDLYLDDSFFENLINSKASAISWLKTQLVSSLPHMNIKSIVVSGTNDLSKLLYTLKSIHSVLDRFHLDIEVKVSVAFSLSFLEKLNRTQENDLHGVLGSIKRAKSFVTVETNLDVDLELGMKDLLYPINDPKRSTPPGTLLPDTPAPAIVTVPATNPANPVTVTPTNPVSTPLPFPYTTPVNFPPANPSVNPPVPITNPVTTPAPITVPGAQPVTNPVTTYPAPAGNVPVTAPVTNPVAPPATTNAPAIPGQSWCVARSGVTETALQLALDYACGMGGADCSQIQQGGNCFNPNSLQNHASFAFNSYYQKNPAAASCDFGGTATVVNVNPSTSSCIYPVSSSSSGTPSLPAPTTSSANPATTSPAVGMSG
ncbi:hypothetical protein OIU84_018196 [Salix udensis]|uniref:X8 domain-containing protein n=1 Tax=Salix udensis TaxID=889485 RepID=A0AAD6PMM7_9ROSI|nr:hypothetical protein OIU84_018196 [Salix udensis]